MLSDRGILVGAADTSMSDPFSPICFNNEAVGFGIGDCFVSHAFEWRDRHQSDLGVLPGGGSSMALWVGDAGLVVGVSQNGETDPVVPGFPENRGVVWKDGQITDLGTLGGNESYAVTGNNRGQVVGYSVNTTPDPFSFIDFIFLNSSNGTQTRAVLWQDGVAQDLGTLGGPDSGANYVNEHGQVAGVSYTNSTPNPVTGLPTFHPFLWEKGKGMRDLGTLGGTAQNSQNGLNERGQVIGSMTLAGDLLSHPYLWDGEKLIDLGTFGGPNADANAINDAGEIVGWSQYPNFCPNIEGGGHAFLWRHGVMSDLGNIPGADTSEADAINAGTQIVGFSAACDGSVFAAFIWENGAIADLNSLIPAGSALYLFWARFINDRGEITGLGVLPSGEAHAFLLIPCDEGHPNVEGCDYSMVEVSDSASAQPRASGRVPPAALWRQNTRFHFFRLPKN